jgi:hypothetical protein
VRGTGQTGAIQNWANGLNWKSQQLGQQGIEKDELEAILHIYGSKTWRKQYLGFDSLHRSDRWGAPVRLVQAVRPQILEFSQCVQQKSMYL